MLLHTLYIAPSRDKGKGVFTNAPIAAGTLIEIAPVLILPAADKERIDASYLYNYYFLWGEEPQNYAIALGYGSLYNHSYEPNCQYETYYEAECIHFITITDVAAGEELCINYNWDVEDKTPVWFDKK